ncbi:MAG: FKBP-type peptidyl-prolyl cis-trans isomerase [Methanobacteriota archaeon]
MVSKKQLEPKRKKTGITLLALTIIIIIALVIALFLPSILQPKTIEIGDCATVEYIGKYTSNGTIFTTTYDDSINKTGGTPHNLFINPNKNLIIPSVCGPTYAPIFMPPGAIRALIGMKEGETKNVTLSPAEGYGDWDTGLADQYGFKTYPVNETWNTNVEDIPTEDFSYYFPDVELKEGTLFDYGAIAFGLNGILNAQITKIVNNTVTFTLHPINGTTFTTPIFNWAATILVTNDTAFTIHSDIPLNYTFTFQDPDNEETIYGKVIAVNETDVTIGLNTAAPSIAFVGQSLTFEFKVVKITKTTH